MDPFFDDDDVDPDSAFVGAQMPHAMQSTNTGLSRLPLSGNAASFAGGSSKPWTFDDDIPQTSYRDDPFAQGGGGGEGGEGGLVRAQVPHR